MNLYAEVHQENEKSEYNNLMAAAYLGAALSRTKRMPKFDTIVKHVDKEKKQMTSEQMYQKVKQLNVAFGGVQEIGDDT
ncbi:MAG: hypothetical protein MJA31_15135 [Clostridia bacterium]|nr:hypothetical protein [Clostridia bacterium]